LLLLVDDYADFEGWCQGSKSAENESGGGAKRAEIKPCRGPAPAGTRRPKTDETG